MQNKRIVRSVAGSLSRLNETKAQVASSIDSSPVTEHLNRLTKPRSPSASLRKAGVALIVATPDPFTAVPGVALIASSYAAKRREPAKLGDIATETRKILRDIQSLRL
jgi:hypothetical protein